MSNQTNTAAHTPEEQAANSLRYEWMLTEPETARHLLLLLQQGKGDAVAFTKMVDRIRESAALAKLGAA